jgi:hypothetical protein
MSAVGFLVGRAVVEVQTEPEGSARIIFELGDGPTPALYADVGASIYEDVHGKSRALSSMTGSVCAATSTDNGTLSLSFADGSRLRCEPHPLYEAWEVAGGTPQYLVVCTPGGGLAVWDSSHIPTAAEAQATVARLSEITGWDVEIREITDTGGIIIAPSEDTPVTHDDA